MPTQRPHSRHAGFSLLEVLIVVSIMAVLMSVLIGGAAAAYSMARQNRTKAILTTLDSVVAEYHQTTGDYPEATAVTNLNQLLSFTYGGSSDGSNSIGRCGELIRGLDNRLVGSPPTDVKDAWDHSVQFWNPNRGVFNAGTTYYVGDVVKDGTQLFRRIANDGGSGQLTTDATTWTSATAWARPWFWSVGSNGVNESGNNGRGNNGSTGGDDLGSDGSKQ